MSKIIAKAHSTNKIKCQGRVLHNELREAYAAIKQLLSGIEELWLMESATHPVFRLSSQMRHNDITLSESNTRAKCSSAVDFPMVVVEPAVPNSDSTCKAIFKINKLGDVAVGLCFTNLAVAKGPDIHGNFLYGENSPNHGTCVIFKNGACCTHGNPPTKSTCFFTAGERVGVQWIPESREVSWWVEGTDRKHTHSMPSGQLEQGHLHFIVAMRDSDVSITE